MFAPGRAGGRFVRRHRGGQEELTKRARVHEPKLPRPGEREHGVGMLRQRVVRLRSQQLAAHPKMYDEYLAVVPFEQQVLPVASGPRQLPPLQGGEQFGWVPAHSAPSRNH